MGHAGSSVLVITGRTFVAACELLVVARGASLPDQGSNVGPLHWEFRVSAIGPPGKSLIVCVCVFYYIIVSYNRSNIMSDNIITYQ